MVELPDCMQYIWKYFIDLDSRRGNTGYGPLYIQYSEILAYFNLYKIEHDPIEVKLLELLDGIAMQHYSEQIQKDSKKSNKK